MLSLEQGKKVVDYAREVLEAEVGEEDLPEAPQDHFFKDKKGVFVTLNKDGDLRGCIGITEPEHVLSEAIRRAAASVTNDPRFPPLQEDELEELTVEVTVLTEPEKIQVDDPEGYLEEIEVGREGLLIEKGPAQGLLLPQVPVEQGWDVNEFLRGVCQKARLRPDSWKRDSSKIYKFQGQIFGEKEPGGRIVEREI